MKKERRHHSAEQKVTILRRHLLDKVAISDLCEEFGFVTPAQKTPSEPGRRPYTATLSLIPSFGA